MNNIASGFFRKCGIGKENGRNKRCCWWKKLKTCVILFWFLEIIKKWFHETHFKIWYRFTNCIIQSRFQILVSNDLIIRNDLAQSEALKKTSYKNVLYYSEFEIDLRKWHYFVAKVRTITKTICKRQNAFRFTSRFRHRGS